MSFSAFSLSFDIIAIVPCEYSKTSKALDFAIFTGKAKIPREIMLTFDLTKCGKQVKIMVRIIL